ncbi:MAG: ketoacyl-ACP synthase III [Gallionella sp.]|nr:ketoacyl-ACP synthase III [Gallionella sp.]PIR10498.1 MAG: 3-oxoacyl-ACP synthase [Gallionellaceae bacterium CG11_big_fil_rev_8_21_14_0_20_60_62]PIV47656.1 MAG: 3-oxoacyl-ACP synthase [Gallionellaceae bacterium CG02_land_8_20_14_3_00_60_115]PJC05162.1 MAG: 3-oxoacyl-ACP synthase [Gallionellaceae bacterium CG_4_9_14_0_8_um_filter_60_335]
MIYSRITGTGSYLPEKTLTNFDLEKLVETSHDWIMTRSGIAERHIAADSEMASDLAFHASLKAIEAAAINPQEVDLIIVATTSPDMPFPSTACILQDKLGIKSGGAAFDIQAVCGGFVYALNIADMYIRSGQARTALVVGAEVLSRMVDWRDRTTCVLFGDGAGAVILRASEQPGVIAAKLHADGSYRNMLKASPTIEMDGKGVFKFAVNALSDVVEELLASQNLQGSDIDWLVPHQANIRIIEATAKKLGLGMNNVVVTVAGHGNTSSASIPLALDTAVRDGRIKPGQKVLIEAIGGGFTWGAALINW